MININQGWRGRGSATEFTLEMAEYIKETSPSVKRVLPNLQSSALLINGQTDLRATIVGTEEYYQKLNKYYPAKGKFIDQLSVDSASNIIVWVLN